MNEEFIGKKYNNLTVLEIKSNTKKNDHHLLAVCKCDCGKVITIRLTLLKNGQTSCGCQNIKKLKEINTKHGDFGTRLYRIWNGILCRTKYKSRKEKERYWGRRIDICEEWQKYENFKKWALSNGYKENLTIDRIDVNRGYSPENCRWATRTEQQNNRRDTRWIIYKGKKKSISDWCRELGLNPNTIKSRYNRGIKAPFIFENPIIHKRPKMSF